MVHAVAGLYEKAGVSASGVDRIRNAATRMVGEGITPAQVVYAARRGVVIVHQADGKLGPDPEAVDLTVDALFPVCSITKLFTATSVMMLVEQGRVGLNRPVCDYIPEFAGEGKENVRIHHLLTHTSGLDSEAIWLSDKETFSGLSQTDASQDPETYRVLHSIYRCPLKNEPGEVMSYTGYGYELLGEIVRRVSGLTHDAFAANHIFGPLGMRDTYYRVPDEARNRVVRRSPDAPCAEWIETEECLNSTSAGGGAYSTANDLGIFGQMFLNGGSYNGTRILSPVSVREMTKNQIPGVSSEYRDEVFPEAYWGYGWAVNGMKRDGGDLFSPDAYSHWGAGGPFVCVDPVYETVTVHLSVELDHRKPFKNMYADYFNNTVLAAITDL
ncbi:serine hydrolase domain-containing protein [Paenibacillus thailandensis]|uniref:Serine hydrolase domain-containing protein n=1 Tax=Paenibacillus thailandensis TaxID=393250 RepID=A0ABW5QUN6_9BACL